MEEEADKLSTASTASTTDPQKELVLVCADASPNANNAFDWYVQNVYKPHHKLLVVHCIEPPSVQSRDPWGELPKKVREATQAIEDTYIQKMKSAGLSGKVISEFGHPGEKIVSIASFERASFIVIGTRGMGQLRRTIMGSVSDYVVHHAHCPVFVCRHKSCK